VRAFRARSFCASLSNRCVPLFLMGIGVGGFFFGFEAGARGSLGAAGPGTCGRSRRGIDSLRGRY
jgi:hypothetical protein